MAICKPLLGQSVLTVEKDIRQPDPTQQGQTQHSTQSGDNKQ